MSSIAIRLLTLATYVLALAVVPAVTPAIGQDEQQRAFKEAKSKGRLASAIPGSPVGRGLLAGLPFGQAASARSFECGTWPLPIYDDPDRKFQALMAAERT
jgi:hypothetical protein